MTDWNQVADDASRILVSAKMADYLSKDAQRAERRRILILLKEIERELW